MTLRAGYATRTYVGVVREGGMALWTCKHTHRTPDEARACSEKQVEVFRRQREKAAVNGAKVTPITKAKGKKK
jgi:hypothetical protein